MKIFAVKDMKAQIFLQPNVQRTVADAIRSWTVVANEGDSMISKFPNDFRLYCIGEFDSITGSLTVLDPPSDLGSAADVKERPAERLPFDAQPNN